MAFDEASGDDTDARAAIHDTLGKVGGVNDRALNALRPRNLSEAQFFGDWYSLSDGSLIWNGDVTTTRGRQLTRPSFTALNGQKVASSDAGIPDVSEGGQFAHAFTNPPYGLSCTPAKVQQVFDRARETLLPKGHTCVITDWTSPDLDAVSNHFEQGKEWWGVFLFTIYDTTNGRLTMIVGSATD